MSTLAQTSVSPATQAVEQGDTFEMILEIGLLLWLVIAITVSVYRYRIYRPSAVAGRDRLSLGAPLWPLWVGFVISFITWILASVLYGVVIYAKTHHAGTTAPATEPAAETIAPFDLAVLSVLAPAAAFLVAVLVLPALEGGLLRGIGFTWRQLPAGLKRGVLAALVVMPIMFVGEIVLMKIYEAIHFEHPKEHDLLVVMHEPSRWTKHLAILGAVLAAPVFEELLFRGLLQTAITEWLLRLMRSRQPALAMPVLPQEGLPLPQVGSTSATSPGILPMVAPPPPMEGQAGDMLDYSTVGVRALSPNTSPGRSIAAWVAIVITAGAFAIIHPLWTSPLIFLLAIMLGYVYERTGNLWTSIAVHAIFNATSTAFVLFSMQ